jgi:hypothetical protein
VQLLRFKLRDHVSYSLSPAVLSAGLETTLSVSEFQHILAEKTGVAPEEQELLGGFPPVPIQLPGDPSSSKLSDLPVANGDTIVVRKREGGPSAASSTREAPSVQPTAPSTQVLRLSLWHLLMTTWTAF